MFDPIAILIISVIIIIGIMLIWVFHKQADEWKKIVALDEIKLSWANFSSPSQLSYSRNNIGTKMKILNDMIAVNIFNLATAESVTKIPFSNMKEILLNDAQVSVSLNNSSWILKFKADGEEKQKFLSTCKNHAVVITGS